LARVIRKVFLAAVLFAVATTAPMAVAMSPGEWGKSVQLAQARDPLRQKPKRGTTRRFAALRSDEVNVRVGPGVRYPVKWVFRQKAMPVEVIQEYDTWRKIRDWEGAEGWVHRAMLARKRSIIVIGKTKTLRRRAAEDSPAVARLTRGVVAELDRCSKTWCLIDVGNYEGWIKRDGIWGVRPGERVP